MLKKLTLVSLLLSILLMNYLVNAETKVHWQKVGDGLFEIWDLGSKVLVENVEEPNTEIIYKARNSGIKLNSYADIQKNAKKINLKECRIKVFTPKGFFDRNNLVSYDTINYDKNKKIFLKIVRVGNSVMLARAENSPTPFIIPSEDKRYYFFFDENELWGIVPSTHDNLINYKIFKLTNDKIDGKSIDEIWKTRIEKNNLFWCDKPMISSKGSNIAYTSNKSSFSKGITNWGLIFDLWIINTNTLIEKVSLSGTLQNPILLNGWLNDNVLIYLVGNNSYLYDVKTSSNQLLFKNFVILTFNNDTIFYGKKDNSGRLYYYNFNSKTENATPTFPGNLRFSSDTSKYLLSPDGTKLLVDLNEVKGTNERKIIYIVDLRTKTLTKVDWPKGTEKGGVLGWLNDRTFLVRTNKKINNFERYITWVVNF